MNRHAIGLLFLSACLLSAAAHADEATPLLPAGEIVAKVMKTMPGVLASDSMVGAEEANRRRLEAGDHEWNLRLGGQRRRSNPPGTQEESFGEWNAALERPLRLPGKGVDDTQLGATGVAVAESARQEAMREGYRALLRSWFLWLKEGAAADQWAAQTKLLAQQAGGTRRRQQLGDAARLEAVQSEAAQAQAEAQAVQARLRRDNAALELQRRFPGLPLTQPADISPPPAIEGTMTDWIDRIVSQSHEVALARGEAQKARISAGRAGRDRVPDPTVGFHVSTERGGEDHIVGAYISIPLPGDGRRAIADGALAQSAAASHREAAVLQKVSTEAATLHQSAVAALAAWQASLAAARQLGQAADMSTRAYALGEGNLGEMLASRRLANEAQLAARVAQLDAFELRYRLLLEANRLWSTNEATR